MILSIVLAVLFALPMLWGIGAFQRLKKLRHQCWRTFTTLSEALQERRGYLPHLVDTAQGYMKLEQHTLETLTLAHQQAHALGQSLVPKAASAAALHTFAQAEAALSDALRHLFSVAQAYPDLLSNAFYMETTQSLNAVDSRIRFAQQAFNVAVNNYNDAIVEWPARLLRFKAAHVFTVCKTEEVL